MTRMTVCKRAVVQVCGLAALGFEAESGHCRSHSRHPSDESGEFLLYVPKYHSLPDTGKVQALMQAHPLGAWVVATDEGLVANHVPFCSTGRAASSGP